MRTSVLIAHAVAANSITFEKSTASLVNQIGLSDFEIMKYHQYENYTLADYKYDEAELVKEYYEGSSFESKVHNKGNGILRTTQIRDRTSAEDKEYMQRFLQLKFTIKFLQTTKKFLRYCYYGCWCLPNGASDLGVGTGPPVDDIDRSCREFATCYSCLYNQEIGGTCDEDNPGRYVIRGKFNSDREKYLVCMDAPNSCKRKRCECDVELAKKLQEYEGQWNMQNHRRLGSPPFNAEEHCRIPVTEAAGLQNSDTSDGAGFEQSNASGGLARIDLNAASGGAGAAAGGPVTINRIVSSAPIYGEIVGCCGRAPNVHYFREGQQCCPDGEVVDLNAPCNMDFTM